MAVRMTTRVKRRHAGERRYVATHDTIGKAMLDLREEYGDLVPPSQTPALDVWQKLVIRDGEITIIVTFEEI